ncbi:MAG: hypothetical protein LC620_06095 [Halobacteriales archaeon]|nr:hypothetical protein [Halobacteriales archaeon]
MHDGRPWYMALWAMVDGTMRRWAETLQRLVRLLRFVRALLVVGVILVLASAVLALLAAAGRLDMKWFLVSYAWSTVFLVVPLAILVILVGLPLRARSVTRLIDMGYPANARELAIRVFARKLRDESIETEELLVETALNEGRKVMRRMEEARRRAAEALNERRPFPSVRRVVDVHLIHADCHRLSAPPACAAHGLGRCLP